MQTRLLFLVILFLLAATMGCSSGPELGTVVGKVTLDGKPINQARVIFRPEKGRLAAARTDAEGMYELRFTIGRDGAILGKHTVTISSWREASDPDDPDPTAAVPEVFHVNYNRETKLTRNIESGENRVDFDLKSDGSSL